VEAYAEIVEDDDFTRPERAQMARANLATVAPYLRPSWAACSASWRRARWRRSRAGRWAC
jgi:hypothetical protein